MLSNDQIAKILHEVTEYLAMEDDPFRPRAYEKAARVIELYGRSLRVVHDREGLKGLERIPGIGKEIAKKIKELLETGKLDYLERLKASSPVDVSTLTKIEGLGPKKIKSLWQSLGVIDIKSLEKVLKEKKIQDLEGFGEKSEQNILKGLEMLKQQKERLPLGEVLPVAKKIKERFEKLSSVKHVEIAGSLRREKETVGDIDILICSDKPEEVMSLFKQLPQLDQIYGAGGTKASGRLSLGIDVDVRVVGERSFGAALQYFTGNQLHNVQLRQIAKKKGLKLNEYGLFRGKKQIAGKTEIEVYKKLGVIMPSPKQRKGEGEIKLIKTNVVNEKSVGAVIFYRSKGENKYLTVHYPKGARSGSHGHWDYVKGHVEKNEDELATLKREIKEETNLEENDYNFVKGFKEILNYNFRSEQGLHFKQVVFYLIRSKTDRIKISPEHDDFKWLNYEKAINALTFKGGKDILKKANNFLQKNIQN